jgi:hypothetical protein
MATSILHSQNFRFQITIYLEGNWDFLAWIHSCMHWIRVHILFYYQKLFGKQIRMYLLFEYYWYETALFTKHKHVILTCENGLKYSAWQLRFALFYKWYYIEKILKTWWYPTMDNSARDFFFTKRRQAVTLDINIQLGELVCSIRVYVPRRVNEGGGM